MPRRTFDDSCNPPAVGPLASASWSPAARRWSVRLTADGYALVVDYLTAKPGDAMRRLKRRWPAVYGAAVVAGLSEDDIAEACEAAVLRAAETFDPARGVPFTGYLTPWLRGAVGVAVRRWTRHHAHGVKVVSGSAPVGEDDGRSVFDGVSDDARRTPAAGVEARGDRGAVTATVRTVVGRVLDATAALVVSAVFGLDGGGESTVAEVASALGYPQREVRAVLNASLSTLARHLSPLAA